MCIRDRLEDISGMVMSKAAVGTSWGNASLRGVFVNRNKRDLLKMVEANLQSIHNNPNLKLTPKQKESYQFIFDMVDNLTPDQRGEFFDNITESLALSDKIVNNFTEKFRPQAKEAFRMTLSTAGELNFLHAATLMLRNSGKLNPKNLKKADFSELASIVHEQERNLRAQRLGVQEFCVLLK